MKRAPFSDLEYRDLVEREFDRARRIGASAHLFLARVDVDGSDEEVTKAETLVRSCCRDSDFVRRLPLHRLLVIMWHANANMEQVLRRRLSTCLLRSRPEDGFPSPGAVSIGGAAWSEAMSSSAELLERCLSATGARVGESVREHGARSKIPARSVRLALGGGAARAAAHVGVLRALAQNGAEIAGIAGTSAGAIVGAMVAIGNDDAAILSRFETVRASSVYRAIRRAYVSFRRSTVDECKRPRERNNLGLLSGTQIAAADNGLFRAFIEHFVGPDRTFESLPTPLAVTAIDLIAGKSVVIHTGSLHEGLMATCAVPGLFPPQQRGGDLLVDGAALSEVPIEAAHRLAIEAPLVAVYLDRQAPSDVSIKSSAGVISRLQGLVHRELVQRQLEQVDVRIDIPMHGVNWLAFSDAAAAAAIGEAAALEVLASAFRRPTAYDVPLSL